MNLYQKAISLAVKAHENQIDWAGYPYFLHVIRVSLDCAPNIDAMIVGVLHDTVEDKHLTLEDIAKEGFSTKIIEAIDTISRKDESYKDFIDRIKTNHLATIVKIADLKDNMRVDRLPINISQEDLFRLRKYKRAYHTLTGIGFTRSKT